MVVKGREDGVVFLIHDNDDKCTGQKEVETKMKISKAKNGHIFISPRGIKNAC